MFRLLLELLIPILVLMVARSVFSSVAKEFGNAAANAFGQQPRGGQSQSAADPKTSTAGELHKDPVCGTYVTEATPFRRQLSGRTIYYCSENCMNGHEL